MVRFVVVVAMVIVQFSSCHSAAVAAADVAGSSSDRNTITTPKSRRDRFPSIDERVQLYMSNWYAPPCSKRDEFPISVLGDTLTVANTTFGSDVIPDQVFWVRPNVIFDCARSEAQVEQVTYPETESKIKFRQNMRMYCFDVLEMMDLVHHVGHPQLPLLVQFGDLKHSHVYGDVPFPHMKKFRSGTPSLPLVLSKDCYTQTSRRVLQTFHSTTILQPIIWKLATHRHYRNLEKVCRHDTEWDHKVPRAVWKGQLTGSAQGFDKTKTPLQNCLSLRRCRLVYQSHNSTLVDAQLTTTRNRLPNILNEVPLVSPKVTIQDLMKYKALIMLEGNDVASGLKWALLSQSVVLMPPPKHTSWAMEEWLIPWVHYIPLLDDISDVEQQMQWVVDHDDEARRISERATLWMEDLCFHPDAKQDDRLIMEDMLRRYSAHFDMRHIQ